MKKEIRMQYGERVGTKFHNILEKKKGDVWWVDSMVVVRKENGVEVEFEFESLIVKKELVQYTGNSRKQGSFKLSLNKSNRHTTMYIVNCKATKQLFDSEEFLKKLKNSKNVFKSYDERHGKRTKKKTNPTFSVKEIVKKQYGKDFVNDYKPKSNWQDTRSDSRISYFSRLSIGDSGGLKNLGNTCYFNAVIQGMLSLESFIDCMEYCKSFVNVPTQSFFHAMSAIAMEKAKKRKVIDPNPLKMALNRYAVQFDNLLQHDAHEFFLECLNILDGEIEIDLYKINASQMQENLAENDTSKAVNESPFFYSPVLRNFSFIMEITISCNKSICDPLIRYEVFKDISLEIEDIDINMLPELLDKFFSDEEIEYNCNCGEKSAIYKRKIISLPKILVIHLKRFQWDGVSFSKLSNSVIVPKEFDLIEFLSPEIKKPMPVLATGNEEKMRSYLQKDKRKHERDPLSPLNRPFFVSEKNYDDFASEEDQLAYATLLSIMEGKSREYFLTKEGENIFPNKEYLDSEESTISLDEEPGTFSNDESDEDAAYLYPQEMEYLKGELKVDELSLLLSLEDILKKDTNSKYTKQSVIHHIGKTPHGGHYICEAFDSKSNQWKLYNDEKVQRVSGETNEKSSYLLFYELTHE